MNTYNVRFYIRSLLTFAVVQAENTKEAEKIVRERNPRFSGIASVELVE
jgi:hypothetical protein